MEDLKLNEMLYAYAAGCLDDEEMLSFNENMEDADIDRIKLGELQNVISLLPAILELEKPHARIKDEIAKRLYKYKTENVPVEKAEKFEIVENIAPDEFEVDEQPVEILNEQEEEIPPVAEDKSYEKALIDEIQFQELRDKAEAETAQNEFTETPEDEKIKQPFVYPQDVQIAAYENKQSNKGIVVLVIVLFILSLAGAGAVYYLLNNELQENHKVIASLAGEVDGLNQELMRLNKVQRILSLLGSKDVWNINLNGTVGNPTGFGKLIIDFSAREGLLQLYNMPQLNAKKFYHLWVLGKDTTISLGSFIPKKDVEYMPLSNIPVLKPEEINSVVLTLEESGEVNQPKGTEYLSTIIQQKRNR